MKQILHALTGAPVIFYSLPFLMINLVAGTIAEHFIGLYEAHKIFFSSFLYWAGPLPLPGTYTLITLLTISLLLKFLFSSEWKMRKAGIILAHLGTLILLIGGIVTALTAREGFLLATEKESTPYIYDYNARELFIFQNDVLLHRVAFENLGGAITLPNFPYTLNIDTVCRNCSITPRRNAGNYKSMARFMQLAPKPLEKENETNLSGVTFTVNGGSAAQNGIYIAFENMPKPIDLSKNGQSYKIMFGKQQRLLPFSINLKKFTRETYPGTDTPRGYSSDIILNDHGVEWPAHIEMNKPLRYKSYIFYQSSFDESQNGAASILNVVENQGRIFPYVATLIIALGLLLHLALYIRDRA